MTLEAIELSLRRNFVVPTGLHVAKCVITLEDERSAVGAEGCVFSRDFVISTKLTKFHDRALEPQEIALDLEQFDGSIIRSPPILPSSDDQILSIERDTTPHYGLGSTRKP